MIRINQRFGVPPERVFDAWIDPATAGRWLFATAWRPMSGVAIDACAGGAFRFEERPGGRGAVQAGRYLEIDRPGRLVFALLGGESGQDAARVSVNIISLEAGCELTLVHESVLPGDAARVEGRWVGMLYGLAEMMDENSRRAA